MRSFVAYLASIGPLVLFCGCATSLHMESKRHLHQFDGGSRRVYVTNPELHKEYEILRASGIYPLSSEPEGARRLTLYPICQYPRCGNPLMLTMLTAGIVPGTLPAARAFKYDLQTDTTAETFEHRLPLYERFSIWEWLVPRNEQKVLAEGLAWSQRSNESGL